MKKFSFIVSFLLLTAVFTAPLFVFAQSCDSLKKIFRNPDFCDKNNVSIAGTVYGDPVWLQNSKYIYEFQIIDESKNVMRVVSVDNMVLIDGNKITVDGQYYKRLYADEMNLDDTIVASGDNIKITLTAAELYNGILEPYGESLNNGKRLAVWNTVFIATAPLLLVIVFYFGFMLHKRRQIKGISFEGYVESLFSKQDWRIAESNAYRKHDRWIESNSNPDFVFIHRKTNKKIAVECKYKQKEYDNVFWAYEDQIEHYQDFSSKEKINVFVVIGIGGRPKNPKRMFLAPLASNKYPDIKLEYLKKFERDPKRYFSLDNNGKLI